MQASTPYNFPRNCTLSSYTMQFVSDKVRKQHLIGHDRRQRNKPREAGMSDFTQPFITPHQLQAATPRWSFHAAAADVERTYGLRSASFAKKY